MPKLTITLIAILLTVTSYSQTISSKVDELIEPLVETNNYSGTVLISHNDLVAHAKAYGNKNLKGEPNNLDTKFMLASTSAIFTTVAIMQLVEVGELTLDTEVSYYFPEINGADKITIHHLMAQRSGIPAVERAAGVMNINYKDSPQSIEDLVKFFDGVDLLFEPGAEYNHGRSDFILLARIVEIVSARSFGDYLQEKIFEPLNMSNTGHFSHELADDEVENLAQGTSALGYSDLEEAPYLHWSSKGGHASIYSTVNDLSRFAYAMLNNELLTAESWKAILTNHGNNVGYGIFIREQEDGDLWVLNGRSPGYSSYLSVNPRTGNVVIMLGNIYNSVTFFTGPELESLTEGKPYEQKNLSMDKLEESFASKFTGTFGFGPDFYRPNGDVRITYKDGRLLSSGAAMIPIIEEDGSIRRFVNRSYWSTLEFVADENGEIVQLRYDDYVGQKKSSIQTWMIVLGAFLLLGVGFLVYRRNK